MNLLGSSSISKKLKVLTATKSSSWWVSAACVVQGFWRALTIFRFFLVDGRPKGPSIYEVHTEGGGRFIWASSSLSRKQQATGFEPLRHKYHIVWPRLGWERYWVDYLEGALYKTAVIRIKYAHENTGSFQHLSFRDCSDLNTLVASTRIGRNGMSCARALWMCTGYWRNSEGSV